MTIQHTVSEGECIESIAKQYGFFADTLWNLSENQRLRELRKDRNTLLPGDVIVVPEKQQKYYSGSTEVRHRFIRKGVPARLRIKFYKPAAPEPPGGSSGGGYDPSRYDHAQQQQDTQYEPITNARFVLTLDGRHIDGQSDGEGMVDVPIAPDAAGGTIRFYPGTPEEITFDLSLGEMAPIDTVIGVRKRLNNVGYLSVPSGDQPDDSLRTALRQFQAEHNLSASGEIDQATKDKLKEIHGS